MILPALTAWVRINRLTVRHSCFGLGVFLFLSGLSLPAADINLVRTGGNSGSTSTSSSTPGTSSGGTSGQTTQIGQRAQDVLARTSQAMAAFRAAQSAARSAAISGPNHLVTSTGIVLPDVPDGLTAGGLVPGVVGTDSATPTPTATAPGTATGSTVSTYALPTSWSGVGSLSQTTTTGSSATTVTVQQNSSQAMLTWQSFNIGKNTTLNFDQSSNGVNQSSWVAFNKVNDPTGVPSQILGSITAPGQVYVINQNGIIFGGSSQVNTHALVASSLPINDNLISRGLLNNPDQQFLFSQLTIPALSGGSMPAFVPSAPVNGVDGDVVVQAGAQLNSPSTSDHVGGKIALIGPNVVNAGTISTPDGQTILAAGNQVGLAAHDSNDPSLRGLDVYVGAVDSTSGTATNSGVIDAPRADVTIAGKSVNQLGGIDSSTSVSLNGRIDLLADYNAVSSGGLANFSPFFFQNSGLVTLGANSVTQILPELTSTDRVVGTQLALPSQVNMQGLAIHLASGAAVLATGGNVNLNAGIWSLSNFDPGSVNPINQFVYSGGQVYLDSDSTINVAGTTNVSASISENIISVQLLGPELADSPLQRDGALRGQTIQIDIRKTGVYNGQAWVGTPLADTSGYINLIQRSVGELTTSGGTVKINSGGSVVMQSGSTVDASGGWVNYQGGYVQTTQVVSGGHVYDISQATPDKVYTGIYDGSTASYSKWGLKETFGSTSTVGPGTYESGYIQGGNGGAVAITAPSMALDGNLYGNTVAGTYQRSSSAKLSSTFSNSAVLPTIQSELAMPQYGTLTLNFQAQDSTPPSFVSISPTPPSIVFQSNAGGLAPVDPFSLDSSGNPLSLSSQRQNNVVLSSSLISENGFGNLSLLNSDGAITLPSNVALSFPTGGSLTLKAANIDIEGQITAHDGNLNITVYDISPFLDPGAIPPSNPSRGQFTLGSSALIDASGLIIDDRNNDNGPLFMDGGSVSIKSYSANLMSGSEINVSGGVELGSTGKQNFGVGGIISLAAGQDPGIPAVLGGTLTMNSTLLGYAGTKGATLNILAPSIQIGGQTSHASTLLLAPDFFSQGGFSGFNLQGLGEITGVNQYLAGITIASGTVIKPVAQNWQLNFTSNGDISLVPTVLDQGIRTPVSLSFNASGVRDTITNSPTPVVRGDLIMNAGAVIQTDPKANVAFKGDTVAILGSVIAPGGSIAITGGKDSTVLFSDLAHALPTVDLGPNSFLSTAGTTLLVPNALGYRTGSVLNGGDIKISGNIVAESGSKLDVSGASDVLDLAPGFSVGTVPLTSADFISTRVDSNGGSITLTGSQELFFNGTISGAAGSASPGGSSSAQAGTLRVSSGFFILPGVISNPLDTTLVVNQGGPSVSSSFYPNGTTAIGNVVLDKNGNPINGMGYFGADTFNNSHMSSLVLGGTVQFSGAVNLSASRSLQIGSSGIIYADSTVNLDAPYIALGTAFAAPIPIQQQMNILTSNGQPFYAPPQYGSGVLNANSSLIDIGNLSLQNIGQINLTANNGDIRGDGTLAAAGAINMTAGQIYPVTAVDFNIEAYSYTSGGQTHLGSVNITGSGTRSLPLSAGGRLNIYASIINQGGTLRAPIGTINLGWNGIGTGPVDLLTGLTVDSSQQINLLSGSVTSVSAIDPITGKGVIIPYGTNLNGVSWIDPTGTDITATGVPSKSITISASNVSDQAGSVVDLQGGGDLYAYRWVSGLGGTKDILASTSSYAIIPGYQADYAPVDPSYANSTLSVGDKIYLPASNGLPAGVYTLLPARYALLPGAFLVTPKNTTPTGIASVQPDGSSIVTGYRFNGLNTQQTGQPLNSTFEIASSSVLKNRAEYDNFYANTYLKQGAQSHDVQVPRLPMDAGQLVLLATQSMNIQGAVSSNVPSGGLGSLVDIASPNDILIAAPGASAGPNTLVLNAAGLTGFGADSLLIGGVRQVGSSGTTVTVTTNNLTVDNAGSPLAGPDIILVANKNLTVAANADIEQSGSLSSPSTALILGKAAVSGSGDGALIRVSSDSSAQISRVGVDGSTVPNLTIGAGATLSGASLIIDSTSATNLDSSAVLNGRAISLGSSKISLVLSNGGTLQPNPGLVLSNTTLQTLEASAQSLSLLSYSSIDIYGTGQIGAVDSSGNFSMDTLALHAAELRGFNTLGGAVSFNAKSIFLDNSPAGTVSGVVSANTGSLAFNGGTVVLGANQLAIDQFSDVSINASGGVLLEGTGGLSTTGAFNITAPLITGTTAANQTITATGAITLNTSTSTPTVTGGLGASLSLQSLTDSITDNANIVLSSGSINLHANGAVVVGSKIDVSGTAQNFYDLTKYTNGGQVTLSSDIGSVNISSEGIINVAAQSGGGNAGSLLVNAQVGSFNTSGTLLAQGGTGGNSGSFSLDVGSLSSLGTLNGILNNAGFTQSRSFRVRTGDVLVDGTATAHTFNLSVDQGSINVTGTINASGSTGGVINLNASGSVVLSNGSALTVAAQKFNDAGKGGAVSLEAGSEINGVVNTAALLDIQTGSSIDLSVAANTNPVANAALGDFSGTLHLRAPQLSGGTDLQMNPINGTITGASSIQIEGYNLYDLTASGGSISTTVQSSVKSNGTVFGGSATAMLNRLLANNSSLSSVTSVVTGAELINRTGDLTLSSDWDLSTYRFGAQSAPGFLTLRAVGNLVFNATLSDGFNGSTFTSKLLAQNTLLPVNAQSWSYHLVAGADLGAADFHKVQSLDNLGGSTGSLLLGKNGGRNSASSPGFNATSTSIISGHYQVIRTGSGDIDIAVGRDVDLLNQFATIYTAGTQVLNPTALSTGSFDLPVLNASGGQLSLGAIQESPSYPAQYTVAGGNVTICAQNDVQHLTKDPVTGLLIADSSRELPNNWLYRRSYVDSTTNQFGTGRFGDVESTSWWIDFSNFFEGIGALGGGNVTLTAGHDVNNVDAVAPTNARMPKGTPDASKMVELGGGDVVVRAGHDINGGVYYVERGRGTLEAGNAIHTNSTRSPSLTILNNSSPDAEQAWLPTTLFLGKGNFDVSANGDVLLGPTANPFLLPEGYSNTYWYKTYFSTYASSDQVTVSSLGGAVTLRESATLPTSGAGSVTPLLEAWLQNELLLQPNTFTASSYQPWLRLDETDVTPFTTLSGLMPSTLRATAFSGDINVIGKIILSPSSRGTIDLAANGSINGVQSNGVTDINGTSTVSWGEVSINLSDASPSRIPGITSPFAYQSLVGTVAGLARNTQGDFLASMDSLFQETGSSEGAAGVLQTKQTLHGTDANGNPLHTGDSVPVHIYAKDGNISGITLFAGKSSQVIAGRDITDIAFYIQNLKSTDVSQVIAGRDIIAYDPNSPLRVLAQQTANVMQDVPQAGDIQISGPGVLEVFAGRNLTLGTGTNLADPSDTNLGIVSIGNARNPALPFEGASILAGAGIGASSSLASSNMNFANFISQFLNPATAATQSDRYLPDLGSLMGLSNATNQQIWTAFNLLTPEQQDNLALDVFYLVLRDAGRDHNAPTSPDDLAYKNGFNAIAALFPDSQKWQGDISLSSREIKTKNGGDITLFAPGGQLSLGFNVDASKTADQGILTENGGNISLFTKGSIDVGNLRIFTLNGGNEIIWSSQGDIAAGSSSKTVQSAPPTRVLVDPQTGDVQNDLAGLATGGGIGVLDTRGQHTADIDLVAPNGTINAGDAGIRASGNLNIAALHVTNIGNIQAGGSSVGVPSTAPSVPNLGALSTASTATAAASSSQQDMAQKNRAAGTDAPPVPSIITVEVLGYGGDDSDFSDDDKNVKAVPLAAK